MSFVASTGSERIVCVMVGLPARGKTYVAQRVCRYLNWLGISTRVFNVGNYRRKNAGAEQAHNFFDPDNAEGNIARQMAAVEALEDMLNWFERDDGVIAIYDATNSNRARRAMIIEHCEKKGVQTMFIESICYDQDLILSNILEVKLLSPDYSKCEAEKAVEDFKSRIKHYEKAYQTITEPELTFVKLIDVGSQVIINRIQGYLQSRVVYFLMNLHIARRSIFFTRHGESISNVSGQIGGDADLSPRGIQYAKALPSLIKKHLGDDELKVWTSTLNRTIQTAEYLAYPKSQWKALDEIEAGICDGLTYEEIAAKYPEDYASREEDKFNYRYRGGESYRDVVHRLEPVIMELERQHNILIIGHQAVLRCIYAYLMNMSHDELPYIKIPLHTLIKLTPRAYGCDVEYFKLDIDAVDTHRPRATKSTDPTDAIPVTTATVIKSVPYPVFPEK